MEKTPCIAVYIERRSEFVATTRKDRLGRVIGSSAHCFTDFDIANPNPDAWEIEHRQRVPSISFCFYQHATRDGKPYGASQRWQVFQSRASRDAAVAKYLAGAEARAAKVKG